MRSLVAIGLAVLAAVPAALALTVTQELPIPLATLFYGLAIVGASFAMAWGAEAAEHDIPRALALTVVALLAVFPEYAVDIVFAFKAGQNPEFAQYAAANMTGSNRLLLGLGWPTVAFLAWIARGDRSLRLTRDAIMPLIFLGAATLYSFVLPIKASIGLLDTLVLFGLFFAYAVMAAREETEEPDLVGPAATIGELPPAQRRLAIVGLFAFAGVAIAVCASPFADGLVQTGTALGVDEFLLVQWLAPLASEAPEFLVAILLAFRGKPGAALGLLLASKLNQWTLLVGSLPLAYAVGAMTQPIVAGPAAALLSGLPLDTRQVDEVWLTASQSLFGVAVLASLSLDLAEALLLAVLFIAQFVLGGILRASLDNTAEANQELVIFSVIYVLLSIVFLFRSRRTLRLWLRPSKL
jgi:cation:H+ antiporter